MLCQAYINQEIYIIAFDNSHKGIIFVAIFEDEIQTIFVVNKFDYYLRMDYSDQEHQQQTFAPPPYPTLALQFLQEAKYHPQNLIIATYGPSSLFAHSIIDNRKPSNRLNFTKAKQTSLADLYQIQSNIFLIFNSSIEPMKQIYFSNFIQKHIEYKKIIILTSHSKNTLKETTNSLLNYISTSHAQNLEPLPKFREGISGIEADLLLKGEIKGKQILCLIGIVQQYELSSEIIQSTFGMLRGRYGLNGNSQIGEKVRKYNMKKYSSKIYL